MPDDPPYCLPPTTPVTFPQTDKFNHSNYRKEIIRNDWHDSIPNAHALQNGDKYCFSLNTFPQTFGKFYQSNTKRISTHKFSISYKRKPTEDTEQQRQGVEHIKLIGNTKQNHSTLRVEFGNSGIKFTHTDTIRTNLCRLFEFLEFLTIILRHNPTSYFHKQKRLPDFENYEPL